jgi:hypothetical protein
MSKYNSRKVKADGMIFDSRREFLRWNELVLLQKAGKISNLQRQVKFELIPSQKAEGKVVERQCSYTADFVYEQDGKVIVEDTKGFKTKDYIIKRKLMLWLRGIRIVEVE